MSYKDATQFSIGIKSSIALRVSLAEIWMDACKIGLSIAREGDRRQPADGTVQVRSCQSLGAKTLRMQEMSDLQIITH